MTELMKLAGESLEALEVGKKIATAQLNVFKYHFIRESSRIFSSAISLVLFGVGLFLLAVISIMAVGYWFASIYQATYLLFLIPIILMALLLLVLWTRRSQLFRALARHIVKDIFD